MKHLARNILLLGGLTTASFATRGLLQAAWEHKTKKPAPKNPGAPEVTWSQALLWSASVGVLVGLVRTSIRRTYTGITSKRTEI